MTGPERPNLTWHRLLPVNHCRGCHAFPLTAAQMLSKVMEVTLAFWFRKIVFKAVDDRR